jgi:hypothetical protein
MIFPGQFLTDSTLHEARQGRQDIDGRVDLSVVQLTVDEDLSLCDVTSKIRDGMRDIYRKGAMSRLSMLGYGRA